MNNLKHYLDKIVNWFAEIQPAYTQLIFVERYARGGKER